MNQFSTIKGFLFAENHLKGLIPPKPYSLNSITTSIYPCIRQTKMSLPICIEFILGDPTHSRFEHTLNNSLALIILTSIWRYYQFPAETVMVHLFIWRAFCFTSWPYPHPILVLVQYSIYLLCTRLGPILSTIDSKIWAIVRESEDIAGLKEHDRVDKLETAYKLEEHRRVSSRASPSVKRPLGEEQRSQPLSQNTTTTKLPSRKLRGWQLRWQKLSLSLRSVLVAR
jgi:hypothetical protein